MIIEVKVVPSSGKNKWVIDKSGQLKCYLKSPPERGLANNELIRLIAQMLKIPQQSVIIISGLTSKKKRIEIKAQSVQYADFLAAAGLRSPEKQMSILK